MTLTWLDLLAKGGILMVPIAACSLVALALIIDRTIHLLITRDDDARLREILRSAGEDPEEVARALASLRGGVASLWRAGLAALSEGKTAAERAMQMEGIRQMARAERGLSVLGALIALTPMLGFLGTIIGLISAFMQWEQLGAKVEVSNLAGGMYQAMITTAAGLSVAIPGYLFYAILNARVAARGRKLEIAHETFLQTFLPAAESFPLGGGGEGRTHRTRETLEPQLSPPAEVEDESGRV